jgi:hypothetical protein
VSDEELFTVRPYILTNKDNTKYFLCFQMQDWERRIIVPIFLHEAIIEKRSMETHGEWIPDNLSTIEFQAKQKGLI